MIRSILPSVLLLFSILHLNGQGIRSEASVEVLSAPVQNLDLISNWTTGNRPYNDIWGYADSQGDEVAIIGTYSHFYFVDISDPTDPELINGFEGGDVTIWRDMKTYGQWAYGVCDRCDEGLSIFKLGDSPASNGVQFVNQTTNFFSSAHNIFIDEQHGRLYVIGSNTQRNGVIILDIKTNPEAPILLAAVNVDGGYMHDLYVRNHIGYGNSEGRGLYVYNFSNPTNPHTLGSMNSYPQQGYNHSGWLNPAGDVLIMADETHNTSLKAVDVSDLSDIEVTSLFRSELLAPAVTGSIAHNPFVRDNFAIVSYYHDGVQIFDISDPANVQQVAWYDTFPTNTNYSGFSGCWGVYPFLPSGNILGSDGTNGLFVLRPTQFNFSPIPPIQPPFAFLNEDVSPCIEQGTPVTLSLSTDADVIQWFRNGTQVGVQQSYTATSEGTYTAIVYKGPHSFTLDPIEITYGELPDVTFNVENEIDFCEGESTELRVTAGADSYEWFLDGSSISATGNTVVVSDAGQYTVTATKDGCDASSAPVTVNVVDFPEAVLNQTENIIICEGEFTELSTNSVGESYQWFTGFDTPIDGATSAALTVVDAGQYRVEVANGDCVSSTEWVVVEVEGIQPVVLDDSNGFTFCEGETFNLTVLSQGIEYIFASPNSTIQQGADNSVMISEPGSISVIVNTEVCSSSTNVIISESAAPISAITTNDDLVICEGESSLLSSLNIEESYQWFLDGAPIAAADLESLEATQSGAYTLETTNSFGCTATSQALNLEVKQIPIISYGSDSSGILCEGESITLLMEGQAVQYTWFDPDNNIVGNDPSLMLSYTEAVNGTYTGLANNGNCGSNELIFTVEVISPAQLDIQVSDQIICAGEVTTLTAISDTEDFIWIRNGEVIAQNQESLEVNLPGVYSIETVGAPCFSDSPDYVINLGEAANAFIPQPPSLEFCDGETYTLELLPGFAAYDWSLDGLNLPESSNTLIIDSPGTYLGTVTSVDGCVATSESFTFTFNPIPDATINAAPEQTICEGEFTLLESPQQADTYTWTLNGNIISTEANIETTQAGVYQLELTNNACSSLSQEINISVTPNPIVEFNIESDFAICDGETFMTNFDFDFDAYQWFFEGVPFSTEPNIEISEVGIYYLEATQNNCTSTSGMLDVYFEELPEISIILDGASTLCEGDMVRLLAENSIGVLDYQWFRNGVLIDDANVNFIDVSAAGNYSVQANTALCSATSEEVSINIQPIPVAMIDGEAVQNFCTDIATITSTSTADEYFWTYSEDPNFAASGSSIDVQRAGTYTLVTAVGGCFSEPTELEVSFTDLPDISDLSEDLSLCYSETILVEAPLGADLYSWFRDGQVVSEGENTIDISLPGTYSLSIQSGDCTESSPTFNVTLVELPSLQNLPAFTEICAGDEFIFEAPLGMDTYTWSKDGEVITSATSDQLSVTEAGVYSLQIGLDNCTTTSSDLQVELITLDPISFANDSFFLCGDTEVIEINLENSSYDSLFLTLNGDIIYSDNGVFVISESGTYTIIGKTGDCSVESNSFEFIFNDNPEILPVAPEVFSCPGVATSIGVTGDVNYTYEWIYESSGAPAGNEMTIDVTAAGIYTVYAIDPSTGCQSQASVQVNHYEVTMPSINADGQLLTSTPAETYQWFLNGDPIDSATDMTFEALTSGDYQVEITDMNGCTSISEVTRVEISSVHGISQLDQFEVFPNPVHQQLTLSLSTSSQVDLDIKIHNQLGQELYTQNILHMGDKNYQVPVSEFASGLYYITLVSETGGIETIRFVKE